MDSKALCFVLALFCAASAAPESRIVGGTPVPIQSYPSVVALVYHYPRPNIYIQRCVGSLLSSWHVLTSAFCFTGANLPSFHIRAGSANSLTGGQLNSVASVDIHPDYTETPRKADIAVMTLTRPFGLSATINYLYLPPTGYFLPEGLETQVASWGFQSEDGPQHQTLRAITLNKVNLAQCQASFQGIGDVDINSDVICAANEGVGVCFGDSGAPMILRNIQIGVSSFYNECGNSAYPDVFTRVDSYTEWIMKVAVAPTGETPLRSSF